MRKRAYAALLLLLLTGMILACGDASDTAGMKLLAKWRIDTWMRPRPAKTALLIIRDDAGNPVLFLRYDGKETRIGPMVRLLDDMPARTQFVDVDGNRFVVFLVDEDVQQDVNGLLLYRPDPDFPGQPEKSRKAVSALMDKNGMIVAPLGPHHAPEWTHITEILLTPRNGEDVYHHLFSPPLSIKQLFQFYSLSEQ